MSLSIGHVHDQHSGAGSYSHDEPTPLPHFGSPTRHPALLALETTLVAAGTIAAAKVLGVHCPAQLRWLVIPGLLVVAALVPAWIGKRKLAPLGLSPDRVGLALGIVGRACVCIFPMLFLGLWMLRAVGLSAPLRPTVGEGGNWPAWLLYQFLYVAVAEEVFFRGYVQTNTMRLLDRTQRLPHATQRWIVIIVSAGCFALAHVVIQGQIISALTFLPGLVLAWLFARTHTLLAPILFHGLANASYGIILMTLT